MPHGTSPTGTPGRHAGEPRPADALRTDTGWTFT